MAPPGPGIDPYAMPPAAKPMATAIWTLTRPRRSKLMSSLLVTVDDEPESAERRNRRHRPTSAEPPTFRGRLPILGATARGTNQSESPADWRSSSLQAFLVPGEGVEPSCPPEGATEFKAGAFARLRHPGA